MDDGLKQRLIGAVVLLALAVIFVPVIFDREQIEPVDRQSQIPPAPAIEPVTVPEPRVNETYERPQAVEEAFVPDENAVVEQDEPASEPSLNDKGVPQAWTLQVISYKSAERAEEMQQQLAESGYTSYTRTVSNAQGEVTRVYVGPKLDKATLINDQREIEEQYQLRTLLLKFEP